MSPNLTKKRIVYIFLIMFVFLISSNLVNKSYSFRIFPHYIDTTTIIGVDYRVEEMVLVTNDLQLIDTFNFYNQTIDLNKPLKYGQYKYQCFNGYRWPNDSIKIIILIDTAKTIPTKNNRLAYIPPPPPPLDKHLIDDLIYDSISLPNTTDNGNDFKKRNTNQIKESNKVDIYVNNYPVYIVNKSDTIISLTSESISGFVMIQEAKDSLGNWNPIQYWHWNWCGNAYSYIDLKPKHYALTRTPVFSGDYRTKMRLKLRFFNQYYYSNEFDGSVNHSQFIFPANLAFYNERERNLMLLKE